MRLNVEPISFLRNKSEGFLSENKNTKIFFKIILFIIVFYIVSILFDKHFNCSSKVNTQLNIEKYDSPSDLGQFNIPSLTTGEQSLFVLCKDPNGLFFQDNPDLCKDIVSKNITINYTTYTPPQQTIPPNRYQVIEEVKARYIWIVARSAGIPLNIARVRVYNTADQDIASGKPVEGSSIAPGFTVSTLTTETSAFAHTDSNTGKPEWMRIDLGSDQTIKNIDIWNRSDCCKDRLDGAIILLQTSSQFTSTLDLNIGIKKYIDDYRPSDKYYYNIPF
jgi:hypothetical protein